VWSLTSVKARLRVSVLLSPPPSAAITVRL
jgi:hypothetical protein